MVPLNLISLLGLFVMVILAWLVSSHRTKVNWRLVVVGLLAQGLLAVILFQSQNWKFAKKFDSFDSLASAVDRGLVDEQLAVAFFEKADLESGDFATLKAAWKNESLDIAKLESELQVASLELRIARFPNGVLFYAVNAVFASIQTYVDEGANFVFKAFEVEGQSNDLTLILRTFAFGVLPTVIFFAALMAVLYHLGIMQLLVRAMAWAMEKTMGTSGPESMAAAANVLVGHTEAPLVVKPYIQGMTRSELNALMVGGFATISGSLMAIFVNYGISAGHLLTASLISAPAALVIAKIMQPETETPSVELTSTDADEERPCNVIEAAAVGASDGLKLALNITAMLIAFLALLAMLNAALFGVGESAQWILNLFLSQPVDFNWTLNGLFGILFWPLAWVMGITTEECSIAGELLGKKMVVNEFIAYLDLSKVVEQGFENSQGEVVELSDRTKTILTYALCGFSNFGAIGIQIGGIGPLAPERRSDLAQLGLRAMFGGMLAACMTACFAGMLYGF